MITMKKLTDLSNIYFGTNEDANTIIQNDERADAEIINPVQLEDIPKMTVVYYMNHFIAQAFDDSTREGIGIFYIQKLKKVYTFPEFYSYVQKHPKDKFLLCSDGSGVYNQIRAFVDAQNNKIKIYLFAAVDDSGYLKQIGTVENKDDSMKWDKILIDNNYAEIKNSRGDDRITLIKKGTFKVNDNFYLKNPHGLYDWGDKFLIFNKNGEARSLERIMVEFFRIQNQTRIISRIQYNYVSFYIARNKDEAISPISTRYGIGSNYNADGGYYGNDRTLFNKDVIFPKSDLDAKTTDRVYRYIKNSLQTHPQDYLTAAGGYRFRINTKSVVVISAPVKGHRCPTYHFIKGFKYNNEIDIVEVAKGELQTKDMRPTNCYYLSDETGEYCQISYELFSNVKYEIIEAEIDNISLLQWVQDKSLRPELLKAAIEYGIKHPDNQIHLPEIKEFNRLPFGELFVEQLIKGDMLPLASKFAKYIASRADNMNYICGSLKDILPGCRPEETSLIKILNLTKPCYDLLFNRDLPSVDNFAHWYNIINKVVPDGIITKDRQKMIQRYSELQKMGWSQYYANNETVNIINFPEEMKSIYKMINKIKQFFADDLEYSEYEALRHYREIVVAYLTFLLNGYTPADMRIFIEFSLGATPEEGFNNLSDRERAANTSLKTYEAKMNEIQRQKDEGAYAFRLKHSIKKLESNESLEKKADSLFKQYQIIAPSQIYGGTVDNSIEREGDVMDHCVFRSYATSIAHGDYTVLYLRLKDDLNAPLVTIGITKEGRINQTYTFHDNSITPEQAKAIVEWAKSKEGLVTFTSEGRDVAPGGWNWAVELPKLPKPEANWLVKLSKICND